MKKWNTPKIEELNIAETAQGWLGIYNDGGYVGDGQFNLHLGWEKPGSDSDNPENSHS